ncbi:MAG: hypothetical protein JRJ29_03175 [Deltaproteobacteria bacterium]|nr:hypothetical protein [Deltaproteobacteria bacterium]
MKVICSGCGIHLKDIPSEHFGDDGVSHGLCDSCYHHFLAQTGMPLTEYVEGIPAPVVTVTPEGIIGTANKAASKLLGKSFHEMQGFKAGDVFECEYARLPEGCGETIHCSGCTIRRTVMDTMETGMSHNRVPACLRKYSYDGSCQVELLISTEKKGGVVFLRIDELKATTAIKITESG